MVVLLLISFATKVLSRAWILEINLLGSTLSGLALQFLIKTELEVASFCLFLTFAVTSISVVYGLAVLLFVSTDFDGINNFTIHLFPKISQPMYDQWHKVLRLQSVDQAHHFAIF